MSQLSARKFMRTYTNSENIVNNALLRDKKALEQKRESVVSSLEKELIMFKNIVQKEVKKQENSR
jgi:hypothetical protein